VRLPPPREPADDGERARGDATLAHAAGTGSLIGDSSDAAPYRPRAFNNHVAVGVLTAQKPGSRAVWCGGIFWPLALLRRLFHAAGAPRKRGGRPAPLPIEKLSTPNAHRPRSRELMCARMPRKEMEEQP